MGRYERFHTVSGFDYKVDVLQMESLVYYIVGEAEDTSINLTLNENNERNANKSRKVRMLLIPIRCTKNR